MIRWTSLEAWRSFVSESAHLDRHILGMLEDFGAGGATCQEIERGIGRSHQAVSGNLRHLVERGLVADSGTVARTTSGRKAIRWCLAWYTQEPGQVEMF